jgi:hypothetical protein
VISGFRHNVDEMCALLGYYAALCGSSVPTFRDNLSVPSSRVKKSKKKATFLDFLTTLLGYYAALCGRPVSTFRDNLSVPSSRDKNSEKKVFLLGLLDPGRCDR